ncbi:MAG: Ig-like domain-containing protein [Alphaproteobacteria bacterium]
MKNSSKSYSKGYIGDISEDMSFDEFVRILKQASVGKDIKVEIIDGENIHISGSEISLAEVQNRIDTLATGSPNSEPTENSNVNKDSAENTLEHVTQSIIDNIEPKQTYSEKQNIIKSSNNNDLNTSSDSNESPDVILDAIGLSEKPELNVMSLSDSDEISSLGVIIKNAEHEEVSPAVTHIVPEDVVIIDKTPKEDALKPTNKNPITVDDQLSLNQNGTSTNIHAAIISNDTDDEVLDVSSINDAGTNGNVTFNDITDSIIYNTGNAFDYLAAGETTTDTFSYTVSDGIGGTNTADVTVTITGINDGPTAQDDSLSTNEDTNISGNLFVDNGNGLDVDIDIIDSFTITHINGSNVNVGAAVTGDNGGTFTIQSDGTVNFNVGDDFQYLDTGATLDTTINYTITDNQGASSTASVTVTVVGVNDVPVAENDGVYNETDEGGASLTVTEADLLANDTDPENDTIEITNISINPGEGSITDNGDGTWTYTPPVDSLSFNGMATLTYTIQDDSGLTDTATFQIRVFNVLSATNGDDTITHESSITPHKILGLDGNDTITGSHQRDIIIGGNGDDILIGNGGDDDFIFAGVSTGTDTVSGGSGTNRILGSDIDDIFSLSSFSNISEIDMGSGNDTLLGTAGDDAFNFSSVVITDLEVINGNGGNDTIVGTSGGNSIDLSNVTSLIGFAYINGGAGNDTIHGSQDDNLFIIETGSDKLYGEDGDDTFQLSAIQSGKKSINGDAGHDQILGTAGDDILRLNALSGVEHIDLGAGTNTIIIDSGDNVDFSSYATGDFLNVDVITDDISSETITGSQGNDVFNITADSANDVFNGHDGDDIFNVSDTQNGKDRIDGGDGHDQIIGSSGDDTLRVVSITNIEHIDFGAGTNTIIVDYGDSVDFSSYAAGDFLNVDILTDDVSSETIVGSQGNDVFNVTADSGNDTFNGHDGDDIFNVSGFNNGDDRFDGGDGYDQIIGTAGKDTIRFVYIRNIEHIDLGAGQDTLIVDYNDSADFSSYTAGDFVGVDIITDDVAAETITGSQGNDVFNIKADSGNDVFNGHDGDDIFNVSGVQNGDDRIDGGNGHDQILGSSGDDTLRVVSISNIEHIDLGAGDNTIIVDYGDTLDLSGFASGSVLNLTLTDDVSAETIIGSQGNDVFNIRADSGNDVFNGHDGDDIFNVSGVQNGDDHIDGGNGYDKILGSSGDDALRINQLLNVEYIDLGAGDNTIIVDYGDTLDLSSFASGSVLNLTLTDDVAVETIIGSQGDDVFKTRADSNTDILYGEGGADTFMFEANQHKADNIGDFDITEGDKIDISDILSYDSSLGHLINDFVQLVADSDGDPANGTGKVTLMVDVDGSENGSSFKSFAIFDDQAETLTDLINNGHLLV